MPWLLKSLLVLYLSADTCAYAISMDCSKFYSSSLIADFVIWRNGIGTLVLCPSAPCLGTLVEVRVDNFLVFSEALPSINYSKSFEFGISIPQDAFPEHAPVIRRISIIESCYEIHVREYNFHALISHSKASKYYVANHTVHVVGGGQVSILSMHQMMTSPVHIDASFSPSLRLQSVFLLNPLMLQCSVGNFLFGFFMERNATKAVTEAAFAAASLFNLSYIAKVSLVSNLQQSLWKSLGYSFGRNSSGKYIPPSRKRVIMSTDINSNYAFLLPLAALFWKKIVGFNVTAILVGHEWDRLQDCSEARCNWMQLVRESLNELGAETRIIGNGGFPPSLMAQVSRLYAALPGPLCQLPSSPHQSASTNFSKTEETNEESSEASEASAPGDEYLLTSDADLLPLSAHVFVNRDWSAELHLHNPWEPGLLPLFRLPGPLPGAWLAGEERREESTDVWLSSPHVAMFPMAYAGAARRTWNGIMGLPSRERLCLLWAKEPPDPTGRPAESEVDEALTWWISRRIEADLGRLGRVEGFAERSERREAGWWLDQRLLTARVHAWAGFPGRAEMLPRNTRRDRLDRSRWAYRARAGSVWPTDAAGGMLEGLWGREAAVDAHLPWRAFEGRRWSAMRGVLAAMLDKRDCAWSEDWRRRFAAAVEAARD